MNIRQARWGGWALVWLVGCALWWWSGEPTATAASDNWTVPPAPPLLLNRNFECSDGFVAGTNAIGQEILIPVGWTLVISDSAPIVSSTRVFYSKTCGDSDSFIERLQGRDSLLVRSQDIETPPTPGKPFDVILYQQVDATFGGAYSVSGWMVSLCGSKGEPFDCPAENYIVKAIGIDPNGGTDPNAEGITWVENFANFVDDDGDRVGWQNLYTSATALGDVITVFARMTSPFQWHGNLGFMDAFSLVRAPLSALEALPGRVEGTDEVEIEWTGRQSVDVENEAGTHELLFDVQTRLLSNGEWRDLVVGATDQRSLTFRAPCLDTSYAFRVRARAEQPPAPPEGVFPNHRYPGVWSQPQEVFFASPAAATPTLTPTVMPTVTPTVTATVMSAGPFTVTPIATPTVISTSTITNIIYLPMMERIKVC